ncbi:MAG: hypothetical protein HGB35_03345 [Geobacteraceae bacterium]|nr:hypothetical protein [Geobacteraceae bacterium]
MSLQGERGDALLSENYFTLGVELYEAFEFVTGDVAGRKLYFFKVLKLHQRVDGRDERV